MRRAPALAWSRWLPDVRTVALLGVLLAAVAHAEGAPLVQLEASGDEGDVEALRVSLVDWLKPFKFELRRVQQLPTEADPEVAARVKVTWLDSVCVVEVLRSDGTLVRKKELPRGGPPLLISESAALVAHAAIQELELTEKRRVRVSEQPPLLSAEVDTPVAQPAAKPPVEVSIGAWFQSRSWDAQSPFVFGGGAEVALSLPVAAFRPSFTFLTAYQGPLSRSTDLSNLDFQVVSLRGLLGVKRRLGDFELEGGLGGGFDLDILNASSSVIPRQFTKDQVAVSGMFSAALGARWHPTPSSGVMLRVLLDVDPQRRRFVERIEGTSTLITVPWAVRPMIQLGFAFDLVRAP